MYSAASFGDALHPPSRDSLLHLQRMFVAIREAYGSRTLSLSRCWQSVIVMYALQSIDALLYGSSIDFRVLLGLHCIGLSAGCSKVLLHCIDWLSGLDRAEIRRSELTHGRQRCPIAVTVGLAHTLILNRVGL